MKKLLTIIIISLFFPLNIFAYSNFVIPGGENIGISLEPKGLIVVGFYKVNEKYIGKESLRIGDIILKVEDSDIANIKELTNLIEEYINGNKVNITIKRNGKIINTTLQLIKENNKYKTGLYIKDKIGGVGTLTYIDPITKIYGALGHEIALNEVNSNIEVRTGDIYTSFVKSIDRSANGVVGSKNATINYDNSIGNIEKNTIVGLFGIWKKDLLDKEYVEVANFNEIDLSEATIYTTLYKNEIKKYKINITSVSENKIKTSKSFSFDIIDDNLLEEAGGIIQGMSGSPVIQNNKIIGAVTHVVVDDVTKGYGVYIKTMLEEGEN